MSSETKYRFSVLIPAKGDCPYLDETLRSLLFSSIAPSEILIVDDGIEPIYLARITKMFPSLKIKIIKNLGLGLVDALNTGIENASFEYIARLDGDDLVLPDRFSEQLEFLSSHPNVVAVGTQVIFIDHSGIEFGKSHYPVGSVSKARNFHKKCLLAHPSVMYRKSSVLRAGKYRKIFSNNQMDLAEDFDLWLRLSMIGELWNLDSYLLKYRQHPNQISRRFSEPQMMAAIYVSSVNSGNIDQCVDNNPFAKLNSDGMQDRNKVLKTIANNLGKTYEFEFRLYESIYKMRERNELSLIKFHYLILKLLHFQREFFSKL